MNKNRGFSTIEILLSVTLMAVVITALLGGVSYTRESIRYRADYNKALYLAEQTIEQVKFIRELNFESLPSEYGLYRVDTTNNQITLIPDDVPIIVDDKFSVSLTIELGEDNDMSERRADVSVVWKTSSTRNGEVSLGAIFKNWEALPWQNPSLVSSYDSFSSVVGAIEYVERTVLVNQKEENFFVMDHSDPENLFLQSNISINNKPIDIAYSGEGNYVYVATRPDEDSESLINHIEVVDINDLDSPIVVGSLDIPEELQIKHITISGTLLFAFLNNLESSHSFIYTIDLQEPESPAISGILDLSSGFNGATHDLITLENHLFLATSDDSKEIIVINFSGPAEISFVGTLDLEGAMNALSLAGTSTRLFVGREGGMIEAFSLEDPQNLTAIDNGQYSASGDVLSLATHEDFIFALVSNTDNNQPEFASMMMVEDVMYALGVVPLDPASFSRGTILYNVTTNTVTIVTNQLDIGYYIFAPY